MKTKLTIEVTHPKRITPEEVASHMQRILENGMEVAFDTARGCDGEDEEIEDIVKLNFKRFKVSE